MDKLETLLEHYWIVRDQDPELYQYVRDISPELRDFIEGRLGYRLIVNPRLVKLEKIPGRPEPWMGLADFDEPTMYAFLCMFLVFLEDYGPGEQFLLSEVTEFIESSFAETLRIDWTSFTHRRYLVRVLNLASSLYLMRVTDEGESSFTLDKSAEALYESTGISRYMVRHFAQDITKYRSWRDMVDDEWADMNSDKGPARRFRAYRRLFLSPAVYADDAGDPDLLYIKNFRPMLQRHVREQLKGDLHVHTHSAFVVLGEESELSLTFPEQRTVCSVVLQVNGEIRRMVDAGELEVAANETVPVSRARFEQVLERCRELYSSGWSKEFREMPSDKLYREVAAYMQSLCMLEVENELHDLRLMPLCLKIVGRYPHDFVGGTVDED